MSDTNDSDDWEANYDREVAKQHQSVPQMIEKHTTVVKKQELRRVFSPQNNKEEDYYVPNDRLKERQQRERLNVKAETELLQDLLEGCEMSYSRHDTMSTSNNSSKNSNLKNLSIVSSTGLDSLQLKNISDAKKVIQSLQFSISSSSAKSVVWLTLLTGLIELCLPKMEKKDVNTVIHKLQQFVNTKETDRRIQQGGKRKANKQTELRSENYREELDMLYGTIQSSSDSETDDGFM